MSLRENNGIQSAQVGTIAHATDDLEKVEAALRFILPESLRNRELFTRKYLQGHHGNPIVRFEANLSKPKEVSEFANHLIDGLARNERLVISRDLEAHADNDGNLFIRLDKQQAFRGLVELGEEDPIRVKLKFSRLSGEVKELMKRFLEVETPAQVH